MLGTKRQRRRECTQNACGWPQGYYKRKNGDATKDICCKYKKVDGSRPRKTTVVDDRCVVLKAKRARYQSTSATAQQLRSATGPQVSRVTVARCLHKGGLFAHPLVAAVSEWSRYHIVAGLVTSSSPVPRKARCVGERRIS
ncbi:hypothetical protein TNCV_407601 [Trichonephila clavipes]|nr:hypothetical protein TNCV_407601 [Trichonephila clavipes]